MANAADINLTINNFQTLADRTPYLVDLKSSGRYYMADLHHMGGITALLKYLLMHTDFINGTELTVMGHMLTKNVMDAMELFLSEPDTGTVQDIVHLLANPLANPIKCMGHITILNSTAF
jgi:dihydroxy-acid dehydratase